MMGDARNPWPRHGIHRGTAGTVWFVPARPGDAAKPGAYWQVAHYFTEKDGGYYTCSCPTGQSRVRMGGTDSGYSVPCKDVLAALEAERDEGYPPRPRPEQAPAAWFVD